MVETPMVNIGNEQIKIKFDVQAQLDTSLALYMMSRGLVKPKFADLIENIDSADEREIAVLILHGIAGSNRAEGFNVDIGMDYVTKLIEKHQIWVAQNSKSMQDVKMHWATLRKEIQNAGYKGMHLDFMVSPTV